MGIICTISICTFFALCKSLDKLNYLRGDNNHCINIECRQLGTRDWINQFARHLFDNSIENEDDYEIMGVRQTRRNTPIIRRRTSLQVNECLDLN